MVSNTVPTTMIAGMNQSVSIKVTNTGTQPWTASSAILLGTVNDTTGGGYTFLNSTRVAIPAGTVVIPGQFYTFTFTMTAPSKAGTYNPQFQMAMIQDGIQWFGDTLKPVMVVQ